MFPKTHALITLFLLGLLNTAWCANTPAFQLPSMHMMPKAPALQNKAYVLMDPKSEQILASKAMDTQIEPASLTKLMSLFIVAHALKTQQIHLKDTVLVSKKAWKAQGSRMFIKAGSKVSVQDLIYGVTVASGNDATIALAEHVAGTEASFVSLMNQVAQNLGMQHTHFANATGLPNAKHYTTAHDLAILAAEWQKNFPEYYVWFSKKWIRYNHIKQPNRNRLLWRDAFVDGMKTGHTKSAGYCLIASGKQKQTRLISVVIGASSDAGRTEQSEQLLNYGFHFYQTQQVLTPGQKVASARTYLGVNTDVPVGALTPVYITVPKFSDFRYQTKVVLDAPVMAPVLAKQQIGHMLLLSQNNDLIKTTPLFTLKANPKGGVFGTLFDRIRLLFHPVTPQQA